MTWAGPDGLTWAGREKAVRPRSSSYGMAKKVRLKSLTKYHLYKISGSSEHIESEFYYPDELPIMNFWKKQVISSQKFCRISESIKEFIAGQKQQNTAVKKTKYDMNVFVKFLGEVGETREVTSIRSYKLDKLLCNFYINIRRKDKTEYAPDTLSSFSRSIQRHLADNKSKINILKDDNFKTSRGVLKAKRRDLRKKGKGNHPNAT